MLWSNVDYVINLWNAWWDSRAIFQIISYSFETWWLLTHWGRVTHICVGKLIIIGSDNGLSPGRRQAIIWTNAGILLIGPLWTNFSDIFIEIQTFSLKKIRLKMSSAKCCSFGLGLNVLNMYVSSVAPRFEKIPYFTVFPATYNKCIGTTKLMKTKTCLIWRSILQI